MRLWHWFKGWFERTFLGYVDPGVTLEEVYPLKTFTMPRCKKPFPMVTGKDLDVGEFVDPKIIKTREEMDEFLFVSPDPAAGPRGRYGLPGVYDCGKAINVEREKKAPLGDPEPGGGPGEKKRKENP